MKIKITLGNAVLKAELYNNETAKKIYEILPIESEVKAWGDEIYFEIPIHINQEKDAKDVVEKGDIAFWPEGDCFCIFFGKTPASRGDEIRAASKVNVFGKIVGNVGILKKISGGIIKVKKY